jgi:hypothetical protein
MQVIALVADTNGAESELSCVLDSAGADICTDATKLAEVDQPSTAAGRPNCPQPKRLHRRSTPSTPSRPRSIKP